MTATWTLQKAVETMIIMNTAIRNMLLYPITSTMITSAVDRLHEALTSAMEEAPLVFAESEKNLLINGEPLSQKDQERPPVSAFLDMLINFGIRSITFENGLDKKELTTFLETMTKKPESVKDEGGLAQLMNQNGIAHILLDQKVYIARAKDQQILASLDIKDDEIIQYMTGANPDLDLDLQKIKEMAKDPEWMTRILQTGMTQIMQEKGIRPNMQLAENLVRMVGILDRITEGADQDRFARTIGKSLADMDADLIGLVLTRNIEALFGGKLYDHIIQQMDDEKFETVVDTINPGNLAGAAADAIPSVAPDVLQRTYSRILKTERGRVVQTKIDEKEAQEKEDRERQIRQTKADAEHMLANVEETILKESTTESLPDMIERLTAHEEHETASIIIDRLCDSLLGEMNEVRAQAAASLAGIMDRLPADSQADLMRRCADKLVAWIRRETSASAAYEKICLRLQDLAKNLLQQRRFAESISILTVFHQIYSGTLEKNDTIQSQAADIIREIASEEVLDNLLDEFDTNAQDSQLEAGRVLSVLGEFPLERLLEALRTESISDRRVRIMRVISDAGPIAVPIIREHVGPDEPWYFLRNLAYLLGHIESPASAGALKPLLLHENVKIRQEALKSLYRIGGEERGPVLLSILPSADENFRLAVIEMCGNLRYEGAVPILLEMLTSRRLFTSASRTDQDEKICIALGKIGSPEAVPALAELSQVKSFLSTRTYPEKVKKAATNALALIRGKMTPR